MSYSNSYSTSVSYSGSVSYSYPKSESGGSGTAYYSGNIPINVVITVNTEPFDGSVARFNSSIAALGGSVAAMNVAQCAAIQQTAREVSESLINGFFGTINSELSQQLQALDSAIKSGFAMIQDLGKAVADKKNVMEGDYNRITSRYIKIFADLDNECYKRVYALDNQSFALSQKVQEQLLSEPASNAAAANLLSIEEVSFSKTLVFVSSLNRKALEVLKTLREYITQEAKMNNLIDSFLHDEETADNTPLCVPVIWSESDMLQGGAPNRECFIPGYLGPQEQQAISEKVNMFCAGTSAWKTAGETERESLSREFNSLAESCFANAEEETDQRIYRTMMSLWQGADLALLKRS